jgi:hypothetical protein
MGQCLYRFYLIHASSFIHTIKHLWRINANSCAHVGFEVLTAMVMKTFLSSNVQMFQSLHLSSRTGQK